MLFNSYAFIFVFLPIVLVGFFAIGARHAMAASGFLALASLVYYGWAGVEVLPLLLGSICFNYVCGVKLTPDGVRTARARKLLLVFALVANLGMLAIIKYADFAVDAANSLRLAAGLQAWPALHLAVPVAGISFYTFTQIAFLVDCWKGKVAERSFVHYVLFVTYFPHLIAGPILHHAQMMPQFAKAAIYRINPAHLATGLAIFTFGLAKKLLVADPLGLHADVVFNGVQAGIVPTLVSAWAGVLAYTMQIYFDFSGYSDMAVGLSLCFGVKLPLNFRSPYKATSIVDFWRRWHISLSTFLRDYLYVPLGGNRKGPARRYANLFITMVLGGLWHGAAWTFLLWGALHGAFLIVNHLWLKLKPQRADGAPPSRAGHVAGWAVTFIAVMVAWVVFRAGSVDQAVALYKAMLGMNGLGDGGLFAEFASPHRTSTFLKTLAVALFICLCLPPTASLRRWVPRVAVVGRWPALQPWASAAVACGVTALFCACVAKLGTYSPFLYFQF